MLALSCGPAVVTWDCGSGPSHVRVDPNSDEGSTASSSCRIFHPHGRNSANVVTSLTWNHNEQVLATCSSSTSTDDEANVALVHAESGTNLETLSNFFPTGGGGGKSRSSTNTANNRAGIPAAATGLGFGGKSRYLVVSDASGCASVWDLKKTARVRTFRVPQPPSSASAFRGPICTAGAIDPSDTFVAAASGWDTDGALRLYRLREGKLAATLRDARGESGSTTEWDGHGGISAMEFSPLDKSMVSVGTRDGSILLWDVQATAKAEESRGNSSTSPSENSKMAIPPIIRLTQRHAGEVTDIAFSPMNKVLLASSSVDGTVSFHDTKMSRTIQSFRPPANENVVSSSSGASSAVMSVSFASDGVTCAAGTADGRALIYDLRNVKSGPLSTLEFVAAWSNGESLAVSPVLNARFTSLGPVSSPVITSPVAAAAERNEEAMTPIAAAKSTAPATGFEDPVQADEDPSHDQTPQREDRVLPSTTAISAVHEREGKALSSSQRPGPVNNGAPSSDNTAAATNSGKVCFAPDSSNVAAGKKNEGEKKSSTKEIPTTKHSATSVDRTNDVGAMAEKSLESLLSKLSASSINDAASASTKDRYTAPNNISSGPDLTVNKLVLRRMIQDEIDDLREEMENSISNVHVDMLRQFQRQSTEMQAMFQQQAWAIEELMEENRLLREENERLKLPVYEY